METSTFRVINAPDTIPTKKHKANKTAAKFDRTASIRLALSIRRPFHRAEKRLSLLYASRTASPKVAHFKGMRGWGQIWFFSPASEKHLALINLSSIYYNTFQNVVQYPKEYFLHFHAELLLYADINYVNQFKIM